MVVVDYNRRCTLSPVNISLHPNTPHHIVLRHCNTDDDDGGGGGDGGEGPQEKRPDGENRRITEDERYSLKGSIAKDFIKGNLVNATQIEESGGMFEMLRHITTVRELIDDPESPYKLSYDLNTHTTSFYVTSSDHYDKKPWNLTNMETAIRYPGFKESDPI